MKTKNLLSVCEMEYHSITRIFWDESPLPRVHHASFFLSVFFKWLEMKNDNKWEMKKKKMFLSRKEKKNCTILPLFILSLLSSRLSHSTAHITRINVHKEYLKFLSSFLTYVWIAYFSRTTGENEWFLVVIFVEHKKDEKTAQQSLCRRQGGGKRRREK